MHTKRAIDWKKLGATLLPLRQPVDINEPPEDTLQKRTPPKHKPAMPGQPLTGDTQKAAVPAPKPGMPKRPPAGAPQQFAAPKPEPALPKKDEPIILDEADVDAYLQNLYYSIGVAKHPNPAIRQLLPIYIPMIRASTLELKNVLDQPGVDPEHPVVKRLADGLRAIYPGPPRPAKEYLLKVLGEMEEATREPHM